MKASPVERRREPRRPADGEVRLRQTGVMSEAFVGRLLDVSEHGFRTRHARLTLASGDRVEFELEGRQGAARAMWNRIDGSEAETGFRIC